MPDLLASDDSGTRLDDAAFAMIWHPDHGWRLLTPNMDKMDKVPPEGLLLTACFILAERDPEWVEETTDAVFEGGQRGD